MGSNNYMPVCPNLIRDCFAQSEGHCRILTGTKEYRKDHSCPFYQPKARVDMNKLREDARQYALKHGTMPIDEGWDE